MTREQLASLIDHTELRVQATRGDIERVCLEAEKYNFATVALFPVNVSLAAEMLSGASAGVCAAIGFPLGAYPGEIKAFETADAIRHGADEVDMVMNVGALKERKLDFETVLRRVGCRRAVEVGDLP